MVERRALVAALFLDDLDQQHLAALDDFLDLVLAAQTRGAIGSLVHGVAAKLLDDFLFLAFAVFSVFIVFGVALAGRTGFLLAVQIASRAGFVVFGAVIFGAVLGGGDRGLVMVGRIHGGLRVGMTRLIRLLDDGETFRIADDPVPVVKGLRLGLRRRGDVGVLFGRKGFLRRRSLALAGFHRSCGGFE